MPEESPQTEGATIADEILEDLKWLKQQQQTLQERFGELITRLDLLGHASDQTTQTEARRTGEQLLELKNELTSVREEIRNQTERLNQIRDSVSNPPEPKPSTPQLSEPPQINPEDVEGPEAQENPQPKKNRRRSI